MFAINRDALSRITPAARLHWIAFGHFEADVDPEREPDRAKRAWESHLARAKWMTENGFCNLLRGGAPH
jgi:hypothetical protein